MDDLVAHFGGLSPDDLYQRSVSSFAPAAASSRPCPVDASRSPPARSLSAVNDDRTELPSTTLSSRNELATDPELYSSTGHHHAAVDLASLSRVFQRQVPTSAVVDHGVVTESAEDVDSDEEPTYIHHFQNEKPSARASTPTPQPRRNLLTDLAVSNGISHAVDNGSMDAVNGNVSLNAVNEQHEMSSSAVSGNDDENAVLEQHYQDLQLQEHNGTIKQQEAKELDSAPEIRGTNFVNSTSIHKGETMSLKDLRHRLRQQDQERDAIIEALYHENQDLRNALEVKASHSTPFPQPSDLYNNNPRAEAAERGLMEARQEMENHPFVCVLIDGEGYEFHEDLLQHGNAGGIEAANRLNAEIRYYLRSLPNEEPYDIKLQFYVNVYRLLAKCIDDRISTDEDSIRAFMCGFTQPKGAPLFDIVDVGENEESVFRKINGSFHLFAQNVQCKRLLFGCCDVRAYAPSLNFFARDPIIASRITLVASTEYANHFNAFPFEQISLIQVFRSGSFSAKVSITNPKLSKDHPDKPTTEALQALKTAIATDLSEDPIASDEILSSSSIVTESEAIRKWQETANSVTSSPQNRQTGAASLRKGVRVKSVIRLNVNDERVDLPPNKEDAETKRRMLARMKEKNYCAFFHLLDSCHFDRTNQTCIYRHWPLLNEDELIVLRNYSKRLPCGLGSSCRNATCIFGHTCQDQPHCPSGHRCRLAKFHGVDKTAVKIW